MREMLAEAFEPIEEARQTDVGHSLRSAIAGVRRRWLAVLGVFILVVAVGVWRTVHQPRKYRAFTTVRIQAVQSPITGMVLTAPTADFRVDRLMSEQLVIRSQMIARRVVDTMGFRLEILAPAEVRWSDVFGSARQFVDSAAPATAYEVALDSATYTLRSGSLEYGTAAYGLPLSGNGVVITIPRRPAVRSPVRLGVRTMLAAATEIAAGVGTRVLPQTDFVEIAFTGTDPIFVRNVTNAIADSYTRFTGDVMRSSATGKSAFIENKLRDQDRQLKAVQDSLRDFKERNQTADVTSEQEALFRNIYELEATQGREQGEQAVWEELVGRLARTDTTDEGIRRLFVGSQQLASNKIIVDAYTKWTDLSMKRADLMIAGANENNDRVKSVNEQIARVKEELQTASGSYLIGLRSRLKTDSVRIAELRNVTKRYPPLVSQQARLAASVATMQQLYTTLQEQYQLARIAESVEPAIVRTIDPAIAPTIPVSPNRKRDATVAAILGVLLGIALALLLEKLDDSVKSPEEIREVLDVPVLGMIPAIEAAAGASAASPASRLVTHADPRSAVAEAYRSLRTNLAFVKAQQGLRTLVFTSPGPADGKSTTVSNLAITLAQQGQRTLLIDADLRRAVLDKVFGSPRSPGLTDVLISEATLDDAIHEVGVPNLSVMACGQIPANPSELLGSHAMGALLREAAERFDVILLDSPPLLAVTDAAVLSTLVDGTVLVVRIGDTAREALRRAKDQLHAVHARVIGGVMNDIHLGPAAYYTGYGYYYYYSYHGNGSNGSGRRGGVAGRLRKLTRWVRSPSGTKT